MIKVFIVWANAEISGGRTSPRPWIELLTSFLMATYFLRETDKERCTGCGACVEICPVNVVKMEGDSPVVGKEWCIGCGVCAISCPSSAVKLVRKSDAIPPKDFKALHREILKERKPAA
jgi:heterodisulfide reductase subunit A-like polyferredoxin